MGHFTSDFIVLFNFPAAIFISQGTVDCIAWPGWLIVALLCQVQCSCAEFLNVFFASKYSKYSNMLVHWGQQGENLHFKFHL